MTVEQAKAARDAAWAELKRLQDMCPIFKRTPAHWNLIAHAYDEATFRQFQYENALGWAKYYESQERRRA